MCGIIAWAGARAGVEDVGEALRALASRGPDGEAVWTHEDGRAGLGHRRLAINDLSPAGRQPMVNEDGTLRLVCNGEIYNAPRLRKALEASGHRFVSRSDNEVILHGYEEWGQAVVERLEGMFAFAIWDDRRRRLFAARDRVGIKPLCYTLRNGGLVLASTLAGILPLLPDRPDLEPKALAYVLTIGYVPAPWSIWKGISKLRPGHALTWDAGSGLRETCYWEPPRDLDRRPPDRDEWQDLIEEVLREHLLSDVPLGLFLSGGLDSTSVAVGTKSAGQPLEALTLGFPDVPEDEMSMAKATARHLGLKHKAIALETGDIGDLLRRTMAVFDEPQGYGGPLPLFLISQQAAAHYKAVLAGDGGDEVFGGYFWYGDLDGPVGGWQGVKRRFFRPRLSMAAGAEERAQAMAGFAKASVLHRHAWRQFPRFLPEEAEMLLAPMGLKFDDADMLRPFQEQFEPRLPLKRALQRVDLMTFCSGSILPKVDRASMAHSLEVRVPFLDRRIVERGLAAPLDPREATENKPPLRDYLQGKVPEQVFTWPKQGFSLRAAANFDWERGAEMVREGALSRDGVLCPDWATLVSPGTPNREGRIWALLALTLWADTWSSDCGRGIFKQNRATALADWRQLAAREP